jgi:transposase
LYRWRKEFSSKQCNSFPGNGKVILNAAKQELALKKELREIQMGRDILKKAISIFQGDNMIKTKTIEQQKTARS